MQRLGLALSVLILPFAFQPAQSQAAEAKNGTSTVSGRVILKGEPARGVTVMLTKPGPPASDAPRARTDESGRFNFTGVPAGMYYVSASAPGYVSPDDTVFGLRGKSLNISDGEKIENIEIEIKRGGVIAGRVTDSQGRPVIEERINLSKYDANNRARNYINYNANYEIYRTDDRGYYRIYGLPEGQYLVSVGFDVGPGVTTITPRREFYPRVFYPNATSENGARVIKVSEGSEAENIDITVPDPKTTYDIYGKVIDAGTGQPVIGVEVGIGALAADGRYTGGYVADGSRSGPNGEFHIFGVASGKYALVATADESNSFIGEPVIFEIAEGDATGLELKVRKGASISGVAVIEGTNDPKILSKLSQVNIYASIRPASPNAPVTPMGRRPIKIDASGRFRIDGLQAGKVRIMVMQTPETRSLTLNKIEHNGAPASEGIDVDSGEQVTGVRLVLAYGSLTLRGEVKIIGGAFPANQRLFAQARRVDQPMQNGFSSIIDARGQFSIENMTPGEYEVRVAAVYNQDVQPLDREILRRFSSVKERVVLNSNQQQITIVIDLSQKENDR